MRLLSALCPVQRRCLTETTVQVSMTVKMRSMKDQNIRSCQTRPHSSSIRSWKMHPNWLSKMINSSNSWRIRVLSRARKIVQWNAEIAKRIPTPFSFSINHRQEICYQTLPGMSQSSAAWKKRRWELSRARSSSQIVCQKYCSSHRADQSSRAWSCRAKMTRISRGEKMHKKLNSNMDIYKKRKPTSFTWSG